MPSLGLSSIQLVWQQANSLQEEHWQGPGGGQFVCGQEGSGRFPVFNGRTAKWNNHTDDVTRPTAGFNGLPDGLRRLRSAATVWQQHGRLRSQSSSGSKSLRIAPYNNIHTYIHTYFLMTACGVVVLRLCVCGVSLYWRQSWQSIQ